MFCNDSASSFQWKHDFLFSSLLFHIMWREKKTIPQEFKDGTVIYLFKRKGNPQVCDNHRDISLLSVAGKILARVLLNRLNEHLEQSRLLPESLCGFRKERGIIHMIFTARQLGASSMASRLTIFFYKTDILYNI